MLQNILKTFSFKFQKYLFYDLYPKSLWGIELLNIYGGRNTQTEIIFKNSQNLMKKLSEETEVEMVSSNQE